MRRQSSFDVPQHSAQSVIHGGSRFRRPRAIPHIVGNHVGRPIWRFHGSATCREGSTASIATRSTVIEETLSLRGVWHPTWRKSLPFGDVKSARPNDCFLAPVGHFPCSTTDDFETNLTS